MSMIKTEAGWVELGAGHPIERSYETAGARRERFQPVDRPIGVYKSQKTLATWPVTLFVDPDWMVKADRFLDELSLHVGCLIRAARRFVLAHGWVWE